MNSWPLDEGLIDYVASSYGTEFAENELYAANVIAHTSLTIGGKTLDTSKITKELLADKLQEAGGVEANVATGYHAVEFLLWGQDLNGTGPGNGARPASDYDTKQCTNGNCDRRAQYLSAATGLLVDDLAWMAAQWAPGGAARKTIEQDSDEAGLTAIMTGLGSLSYGELAGERMKLGLMIHDPEEEHDCFSDNTHASHFFDALGIRNVYLGTYRRADRSLVTGPSVSDLVKAKAPEVDAEVRAKLDATMQAMNALYLRALTTESYDQMIGEGKMPKATPWFSARSMRCSTRPSRSSAPSPLSTSNRSSSKAPTASTIRPRCKATVPLPASQRQNRISGRERVSS